jgi:hypothetical protein
LQLARRPAPDPTTRPRRIGRWLISDFITLGTRPTVTVLYLNRDPIHIEALRMAVNLLDRADADPNNTAGAARGAFVH